MNFRFGLTEKLGALSVALSIAMMLGACSKTNESATFKESSGANDATRPAKIAKAYFYSGGKCSIDSTKPETRSNLITTSKKSPLGINGWVAEETTMGHILPLVFAVLSGEHGTYYLEGKRVPRPDVAIALGNKMFDDAGFEVLDSISKIPIAEYKLSVATGDKFVVAVCQTDFVVRIGE